SDVYKRQALSPALHARLHLLERFMILEVRTGSRLAVTLAGFALLLVADNLRRHKYAAWVLTMGLLLVSALGHLFKGLDYEEAGLAIALAVMLWQMRSRFHARSDPPSVRQGIQVLLAASLFTLLYGSVGFYLLARHFHTRFDLWMGLQQTVQMLLQLSPPNVPPATHFGRYFLDSIYVIAVATLGYSLAMILRPVVLREPATPAERARAADIVARHGQTPLARLALLPDKAYLFTPGGSVVAFTLKGRVALALGDPIGPSADFAEAIRAFQTFCARNDWMAAFYQTLPTTRAFYEAAGLSVLTLGQEALVDLHAFSLEGRANKEFRNVKNRFARLGHTATLVSPPLETSLLEALRAVSDEWLSTRGMTELRFSLGWFDEDYLRQCPAMIIRTAEGRISAFASLILDLPPGGVSVDLMRHRRATESGTMDFLFVSLLEWAKTAGYTVFDLGLSALVGVGEHSDDPAIERAMRYLYHSLTRFYNYQGLHAFKAKFHPRWEPRYLVYPQPLALPSVVLAIVQALSLIHI
ncbi:MAG: phosphatidylglycerol lysyltransferase domain-containing protein, partial [Thermanaerothrix sp.]|nr:phosphatidylglycerol lysyltransferase domain-containing protein [Thermanaerothrix sp.]